MTFAAATRDRETNSNIFSYTGVLTGTELDSGDIDISGFTCLSFKTSKTMASDNIAMYAKLTAAGDYQAISLDSGGTSIKDKDWYNVDITGAVFIKFLRTGVVDGDVSLDMSLTAPQL